MAVSPPPARNARRRPFAALVRASELAVEGQALCDEVMQGATRIQTLAATGERTRLVNEAGRLGARAHTARIEFRRLASEIEE
jgi:hypothetical protein